MKTFIVICIIIAFFSSCDEPIDNKAKSFIESADEIINETKPVCLENLFPLAGSGLWTKTYIIDGYTYRVFWMGDAINECALIVINLDEQEAKLKYYKNKSNDL